MSDKSNPEKCTICREIFGFFRLRLRYKCTECGSIICSACSDEHGHYTDERNCSRCLSRIKEGAENITVVKSEHVGGHNIVKTGEMVESKYWFSNPDRAVANLKYQAFKNRMNTILSVKMEKGTGSESSGGKGNGTHYYSVFKASGRLATIERNRHHHEAKPQQDRSHNYGGGKRHSSSSSKDLAKELEKLVALRKEEYLTEEEFNAAKAKLLR